MRKRIKTRYREKKKIFKITEICIFYVRGLIEVFKYFYYFVF